MGPYGAGKSHALVAARDLALASGYDACSVTLDSAQSALNHPQRFLHGLLETMRLGNSQRGYSNILTSLLEDPKATEKLAEVAGGCFDTNTWLDGEIRWRFDSLPSAGSDDAVLRRDELVRALNGERLIAATGSRAAAYRLLTFAIRAVRIAGGAGLVVTLDEVESIFTKLPGRLSQRGAYRVLAALLCGIEDSSLRVVLGVTPDAWEWLVQDLPFAHNQTSCLTIEPIDQLAEYATGVPTYVCHPISKKEMARILDRIRELHRSLYGAIEDEDSWQRQRQAATERRGPVRLAIRYAVNFLDAQRWRGIA